MTRAAPLVLVPTYMEAGTICSLLAEVRRRLPQARVLVVDDRSPDDTAGLVRRRYRDDPAIAVVTRAGPRGYAAAMADGLRRFLASDAGWLITLDADLSHDPAVMTRLLARAGATGVVIGSRYLRGAPRAAWAPARMRTSILGNRYVRLVTGLPVADCTSGFRCYARAAIEAVDPARLRAHGFAFQVELLHAIWRAGHPIVEVPIHYRDRLTGSSKLTLAIVAESLLIPWRLAARGRRPPAPPAASAAPGRAMLPDGPA
jgi:dolichol-phosphate mannosyltransferase